jgi:hypothetical protein
MQKRKHSALETTASTIVGFLVSFALQVTIFPLFGIHIPLSVDFIAVVIFTIASLIRGYFMRRFFNALHVKGILK